MGHNTGQSPRRHLLYLAFWYPPSRASGVYRSLATTETFVDAGWDVSVLTTTREFLEDEVGSTDPSLETEIPAGVVVERIPFTFWDSARRDLRSTGWLGANFPHLSRLRRRRPSSGADKYASWISPAVERAVEMASAKTFDHVLATGNPFSSFEAARLIADQLGIGFSIDFRDPWTFDVFSGSRIGSAKTRNIEHRIITEASACFHVNDAIAEAYARLYPDSGGKQIVVLNGYDRSSVGPLRAPSSSGPLRFGALGTVTDRWPLEDLYAGWKIARRGLPTGSEFVIAGHLGYFSHSAEPLRARLSSGSEIRYQGPIEKSQVSEFYRSLDVVVVPVPGGRMVTSGKIYEALALGIPLVCVQARGGGARQLIADHPISYAAEPDARSMAAAFVKAGNAAGTTTVSDVAEIRERMGRYERSRSIQVVLDTVENSL